MTLAYNMFHRDFMRNGFPFIIFFVMGIGSAHAQQDPLYAQYVNNPMLINPAFAGSNERLYAGVAYRSQWSGMQGAPLTVNFNSHVSVAQNKVGLGVYVVQDKLGDLKNTAYGTTCAYRIKSRNTTFSFGMQLGFIRYTADPDAVKIKNNPDPDFAYFTETTFNSGAGLLLQSDTYRIGFSVPRLWTSSVSNGDTEIKTQSRNFYLYGSYNFLLSEQIRFKPSALLRATANTKPGIDMNANLELNRKFTAGIFTRGFNTYGTLLQLIISDVRIGYVYEVPGKNSALYYNTHEVSLSISVSVWSTHAILNGL